MDRVIKTLEECDFNVVMIYQLSERNPQFSSREKADRYNIGLLGGKLKDVRIEVNNKIDTTKYMYLLPPNSRESDVAVLLLFDPQSDQMVIHSTHLKGVFETGVKKGDTQSNKRREVV